MKIYHYTSIGALALILESKKIRFTRLDGLDDIEETQRLPAYLRNSLYVSCWTEEKEENISLWSLYTGMSGIRLEFPANLFNTYHYPAGDYGSWGFGIDTICPLPPEEIRTEDYFITNPFWLQDGFFTKVEYDVDFRSKTAASILDTKDEVGIDHPKNLIRFKNPIWSFQKESRFYLFANPLLPLSNFDGDRRRQMESIAIGNAENDVKYIDVGISNAAMEDLLVRVHPNCKTSDKIIIRALLDKYAPKSALEDSHLNGKYRSK